MIKLLGGLFTNCVCLPRINCKRTFASNISISKQTKNESSSSCTLAGTWTQTTTHAVDCTFSLPNQCPAHEVSGTNCRICWIALRSPPRNIPSTKSTWRILHRFRPNIASMRPVSRLFRNHWRWWRIWVGRICCNRLHRTPPESRNCSWHWRASPWHNPCRGNSRKTNRIYSCSECHSTGRRPVPPFESEGNWKCSKLLLIWWKANWNRTCNCRICHRYERARILLDDSPAYPVSIVHYNSKRTKRLYSFSFWRASSSPNLKRHPINWEMKMNPRNLPLNLEFADNQWSRFDGPIIFPEVRSRTSA